MFIRATILVLPFKELLEKVRGRDKLNLFFTKKPAILVFAPNAFRSCSISLSLVRVTLDHNDSCFPLVLAITTILAAILQLQPHENSANDSLKRKKFRHDRQNRVSSSTYSWKCSFIIKLTRRKEIKRMT